MFTLTQTPANTTHTLYFTKSPFGGVLSLPSDVKPDSESHTHEPPFFSLQTLEQELMKIPVTEFQSQSHKRAMKNWRRKATSCAQKTLEIFPVVVEPDLPAPMEVQAGVEYTWSRFNEYISSTKLPNGTANFCRSYFANRITTTRYSLLGKYVDLSRETDDLVNIVENLSLFWYSLLRARNATDRYVAIANLAKLTNSPINELFVAVTALKQAFEYFCPEEEFEVQSATLPIFETMQAFLDKYELIKASPIFEKLYKFSMYSMALSLFKPLGITMDFMKFEGISKEAIKKKYHAGPDFIHCLLDTLLFLSKRGYQCYQSGSVMPMFHSAEKYQEWFDEAEKLNRQSHFLSNPEVHGLDRFGFLADLKQCIEKGQSMRKCTSKKEEKILISRLLATLELTHDMEVTKRAAQKDRKTPLCVLLYGGSGIGKSTVENILFQHYGKVRGLNTASEFRYVRNPTEEYWSGMNSTQWCIVMDDIGFMSPKLGTLDPSLAELLCVANNVPFVPAQAELSDKGRTPVRAELLLGSTNTEDLNLVAYFSCPLAVQRRFPWIIDIKVRSEFQDPTGDKPGMLCSSQVPTPKIGEYPDLWTFTVKRVEPCGDDRHHQMGRSVDYAKFDNLKDLLIWYNDVIDKHNDIQDTILRGNTCMEDTILCDSCRLPSTWCSCLSTQAGEEIEEIEYEREIVPTYMEFIPFDTLDVSTPGPTFESYLETCTFGVRFVLLYYYVWYVLSQTYMIGSICTLLYGDYWFQKMMFKSKHKMTIARTILGYAGKRVQQSFTHAKELMMVSTAVIALIGMYKTYGTMATNLIGLTMQGGVHSVGEIGKAPVPDGIFVEKPSYADPYPYSMDDLSQTTLCSKGQDGSLIKKHVQRATCVFTTRCGDIRRVTTAVNVRGTVYLVNNHGIPFTTPFHLDITCEGGGKLSTTMKNILVTQNMVYRHTNSDLAVIKLRCRPPGTDLTQYFCGKNYTGLLDGSYVGRDVCGKLWETKVSNVKPAQQTWKSHDTMITRDMWNGVVDNPTVVGDCGTILLSNTPVGWTFLGIHTLGRNNQISAMKVTREEVTQMCDTLEHEFINRGRVEVSAPSKARTVGSLNPQSVIHKSNMGVAHVLGSFTSEFRQRGRTNVCPTYIAPFVEKFGYCSDRTRPDMSNKPWVMALNDTTRPVVLMDNDILDQAKEDYLFNSCVNDYSEVHVYPLDVAINGAPGVAYCDKMNRKSSAGAPYKKSKSHFMYFVDEECSTDMDVIEEIKDTVVSIISTYKRKERVHTIFCGHLKDESVTREKALAGKTRVFTASGMAYTLVVRMYLLSVVVFMQKNRFRFETGPGTVVQSLEWESVREHVTRFGDQRMIAGDYSKFDKRMPANVILAAFDVIIEICKMAGYTSDDILVVRGIAYDTAFPTVDYNGDLIEFFGSNPSGHPLTVIINGIVNSLYMRYCYTVLRPIGDDAPFVSRVALMTYGDDNIMGVSELAPWFNHTAIQGVLAEVDIGYTMADKGAKSVPYITIDQTNFLKRTWRWDADIGAYVAPLERSSITKMLTICVAKKNVTPKHHSIQVIGTAVREFFWYGREEFETGSQMLKDVVSVADLDLYVEDATFPSWDELVADFWDRSKHVKLERLNVNADPLA